jgi:2,4-diketo-3-deoxy-L-fuconate hydrolase
MKLCFFNDKRLGLVRDENVFDVTSVLAKLPACGYPHPTHDIFIEALATPAFRKELAEVTLGKPLRVADVRLLSPVLNPGKIVAAPVNYLKHYQESLDDPETFTRAHVRKIQESGLFLKATSSLIGAGEPVQLRHHDRRTDHEVELAVIIGRPCQAVSSSDALDYVAGYAIGLDITVRGPEERSFRKSIDTYTVLGPWLVTSDELTDPARLDLSIKVNGDLRQHANTRDLIIDVPGLIAFASSFYTLLPGDIIITGTPEGVAPINPGDVMEADISGIGSMSVRVA